MKKSMNIFVSVILLLFVSVFSGCDTQIKIDNAATQSPTIRGTVSIPSGANVSGSDFFIRVINEEKSVYTGKVNSDGSFAVQGLEEGVEYDVLLTTVEPGNIIAGSKDVSRDTITAGYGGWLINVSASIDINTTVGSVNVKPLGTIRGIVVREGAEDGYDTDVYIPGTSYFSTTDAEGNYAIYNVPQSTYSLRFRSAGYVPQIVEGITLFSNSNTDSPVRNVSKVTLIRNTGSVEGFAIREGEADNSGITLRLEQKDSTVNLTSTTAANGYFKIDDVPPGQYRVLASYAGYLSQSSDYFEVSAARLTTLSERIELGQDMGTIVGTASLEGSLVKGGINISIVGEDSTRNYSAVTSDDGSFTKNVASGLYTVTAYYPGYNSKGMEVTVTKGTTVRADIDALDGDFCIITFESNGGSDVAEIKATEGLPIGKPTDPTRYSYVFGGWYTDPACTQSYSFTTAVNNSFTLYAKWLDAYKVLFDLNYEGAPESTEVWVAQNTPVEAPTKPEREGLYFTSWYTSKEGGTPYKFSTPVTENITLYAGWSSKDASLYQLKATHGVEEDLYMRDKFIISYQDNEQHRVNSGDILSFMFRTTTEIDFINIRGDYKWVYEDFSEMHGMTSYETIDDGWICVTYEFTDKSYRLEDIEADAWWRIDFGSRTMVVGDILEIMDFRLNGEPLFIDETNVRGFSYGVDPTLKLIETGPYEWTNHTVVFKANNGKPDEAVSLSFGEKLEQPTDPEKEGSIFDGWYSDEECTEEIKFPITIVEDTTLYAKWGNPVTVTFNDCELDPVVLAAGRKLEQPYKPSKTDCFFIGWFSDALFTTEFDFDSPITENTTIYAKWGTYTYPDSGTVYQFTAIESSDRFQFRFKYTDVEILNDLQAGDCFSFKVRFISDTVSPKEYRLRTQTETDICGRTSFSSPDDNGWYSVLVTIPDSFAGGYGLYLQLFGEENWKYGDKCEIMELTFNGTEIPISDSTSSGAYGGVNPIFVVIYL